MFKQANDNNNNNNKINKTETKIADESRLFTVPYFSLRL